MRDSLQDIDDAWFADADPEVPSSGPHSLEALQRPARGTITPNPIPGYTELPAEALAEFARPSLAVGTGVGHPPAPDAPWFSQLRNLVPQRRARPSTLPPVPTAKVVAAPELIVSSDLLEDDLDDVTEVTDVAELTKRPSWWRRLRKS